jgi:hypothetical protein
MIEFKLNQKKFDDLLNRIKSFNEDAMRQLHASMNRGMLYFIGTTVRTQMSGRKSPNFGLNRISGRLANANRTISDIIGNDYRVRAQFGFPNAPYIVYHQKPRGTEAPKIPKRLYITEEFRRTGYDQVFKHAFVDFMRRAKV